MKFFKQRYNGIVLKRPSYRSINGDKFVDIYPSDVKLNLKKL